jgi:hypothetical protein
MTMRTKTASFLRSPSQVIPSRSAAAALDVGDVDLTKLGSENKTGTDGSTSAAGHVLTSAGGGIPTDATYAGGTLTIFGGANAGEYTIVSTTATTVTLASSVSFSSLTSQKFRISRNPGYFAPFARRIFVGGAGDVLIKMQEDVDNGGGLTVGWRTYKALAGSYITGEIVAIASTANGTTATSLVVEQ